jgi:hypothetical protein
MDDQWNDLLTKDLEALMEKHKIEVGMVAVTSDTHFQIITCNMSSKTMRMLGRTLIEAAVPEDITLN